MNYLENETIEILEKCLKLDNVMDIKRILFVENDNIMNLNHSDSFKNLATSKLDLIELKEEIAYFIVELQKENGDYLYGDDIIDCFCELGFEEINHNWKVENAHLVCN